MKERLPSAPLSGKEGLRAAVHEQWVFSTLFSKELWHPRQFIETHDVISYELRRINSTWHWHFIFMNEEELFVNMIYFPLTVPQLNGSHGKLSHSRTSEISKGVKSYDSWLWQNNAWFKKKKKKIAPGNSLSREACGLRALLGQLTPHMGQGPATPSWWDDEFQQARDRMHQSLGVQVDRCLLELVQMCSFSSSRLLL